METITAKTPWAPFMVDVPMHLHYFEGSMFDAVQRVAEQYPNHIAFDFMGRSTTYRQMIRETERCAKEQRRGGFVVFEAEDRDRQIRIACRKALEMMRQSGQIVRHERYAHAEVQRRGEMDIRVHGRLQLTETLHERGGFVAQQTPLRREA